MQLSRNLHTVYVHLSKAFIKTLIYFQRTSLFHHISRNFNGANTFILDHKNVTMDVTRVDNLKLQSLLVCERSWRAKVSFPQFCLHPSSFERYDPLGRACHSYLCRSTICQNLVWVKSLKYLSPGKLHRRMSAREGISSSDLSTLCRRRAKKRRAGKNGAVRPTQPSWAMGHQPIWPLLGLGCTIGLKPKTLPARVRLHE